MKKVKAVLLDVVDWICEWWPMLVACIVGIAAVGAIITGAILMCYEETHGIGSSVLVPGIIGLLSVPMWLSFGGEELNSWCP